MRRRNIKCTPENRYAGEVELSTEYLAEVVQLLEKYPRKGGHYVDALEETSGIEPQENVEYCDFVWSPSCFGNYLQKLIELGVVSLSL